MMELSSSSLSLANTQQATMNMLDMPHNNDVLCGRGGLSNKHPGNRLFRRLVAVNKPVYQRTFEPSHKQLLALSIIEAIRNQGGRFVRREESSGWVEISRRDAIVKTSQALRESFDCYSEHDSSSSSSSSRHQQRGHFSQLMDAKEERREMKKFNPLLDSGSLAQTLFEVLITNQRSPPAEVTIVVNEEEDFEPIALGENQTPMVLPDEEDDFEPIGIHCLSTTEFPSDLDDLIFGAITGSKTELHGSGSTTLSFLKGFPI